MQENVETFKEVPQCAKSYGSMQIEEFGLTKTEEKKEGGWGFVVVAACALCFGLNVGFINCYALIYNQFIDVYNSTENHKVYAAWIARKIGFIGGILSSLSLVFSAMITDIKLYFVTYSAMLGIGQSLLLGSYLAILPQHFNKRLGLANGLMIFGGTIITTTLPLILEKILEYIGISKTFYILAGLMLLTSFCALTFQQKIPIDDSHGFLKRVKDSLGLEIFKSRSLIIWLVGAFIGYLSVYTPTTTLSNESRLQFPSYSTSIVTAIVGATCGISGIIFGKISDHIPMHPIYFLIICFLISGTAQILLPFVKNYALLCVFACFFGMADCFSLTFIVPISFAITKSSKLATQGIGYYFLFTSIPAMVGPTIFAGWLFDKYSTYEYSYYISGSIGIVAALFLILLFPEGIFQKTFCKNKKVSDENTKHLYKF